MSLFKIPREALPVRWSENDAPTDPQDHARIENWVNAREKILRRTAGLGKESVESFGRACLFACKGHVVMAMETRDPADLVDLDMWEPEEDPATYLKETGKDLDVLLGTTLRLSSQILSTTKDASATASSLDAEALPGIAEAATEIDAMSPEPSSSWIEASRRLTDSLPAAFDASDAWRNAYQLGSIMMALRMLEWGAGERTFGAHGAAKAAACAVIAAQEAALAVALADAPFEQAEDWYRPIRVDAGSAELQRQADLLKEEGAAD
jgi:hypothetical protein